MFIAVGCVCVAPDEYGPPFAINVVAEELLRYVVWTPKGCCDVFVVGAVVVTADAAIVPAVALVVIFTLFAFIFAFIFVFVFVFEFVVVVVDVDMDGAIVVAMAATVAAGNGECVCIEADAMVGRIEMPGTSVFLAVIIGLSTIVGS
ncbi:hypothetical protein RFI_18312 [Reticulomyxa filosa]|uniref:Uncharacterized protein n=1 Tax=Reticulomyxa filosa TaxID=46433 RepID=X6MYR1_RETFI|nr:hypothetical protein RFI_18312 [Reticulomyxa filosa]|eukprot:ETO18931.1 hypothetical protein RFI_18312 [Reticulomyxa filosa]